MNGARTATVALLGGCGSTGEHALRRLVKGKTFSTIRLADANAARAHELAAELGRDIVEPVALDVNDRQSLRASLHGADAVINLIGPYYRYGRACVEAALEAGVHYFDVNDEADVTRDLLDAKDIHDAAAKQQLAIVIGLGTSPGMTNMFARLGASRLTKTDTIEIRLVANASYRSAAVFAHRLHVFGSAATVLRNGAWVEIPAFTEAETIRFPGPPGSGECFIVAHPEPLTIPRFIPGLRNVDVKMGYSPGELNTLLRQVIALGLAEEKPLEVNGLAVSPAGMIAAYLGSPRADKLFEFAQVPPIFGREVRVSGELEGIATRIIYRYGGENSIRYTGTLPALAAEMVIDGRLRERGLLAPEALDPRPFLAESLAMGMVCEVTKEEFSPTLALD